MLPDSVIAEAESILADDALYDLPQIGSGIFKETFLLPSGAVIKVFNRGDMCTTYEEKIDSFLFEWAVYVLACHDGYADLFADTIFGEDETFGHYMIQEHVNIMLNDYSDERYEDESFLLEMGESFGLTDLHDENVGWTADGRPVILDWGFIPEDPDTWAYDIHVAVQEGELILPH